MVCYYCKNKTIVTNSRYQKNNNSVWRRRKCISCQNIITTIETIAVSNIWLVTHQSKLMPFSRDKLYLSIYKCLSHRTDSINDASYIVSNIINKLLTTHKETKINNEIIKSTAYVILSRYDKLAAQQYWAHYK